MCMYSIVEDLQPINGLVLTEVLQMHPDLVHPSRERLAEDDAGVAVEAELLELCVAVLALRGDLANADLVAHNLDGLAADDAVAEKWGK